MYPSTRGAKTRYPSQGISGVVSGAYACPSPWCIHNHGRPSLAVLSRNTDFSYPTHIPTSPPSQDYMYSVGVILSLIWAHGLIFRAMLSIPPSIQSNRSTKLPRSPLLNIHILVLLPSLQQLQMSRFGAQRTLGHGC